MEIISPGVISMRTRRKRNAGAWYQKAKSTALSLVRSSELKSLVAIVFIVAVATASFYWGMRVERARFVVEPREVLERAPTITVTERSIDTSRLPESIEPSVAPPRPVTEPEPKAEETAEEEEQFEPSLARPVSGGVLTGLSWYYSPVFGDWRYHSGIDIEQEVGTPVKAVMSGTIIDVVSDEIMGLQIMIDHGKGLVTFYAGLDAPVAAVGDSVSQNQVIARIGNPGFLKQDKGPHLHFEARLDGVPVDPTRYMQDIGQ